MTPIIELVGRADLDADDTGRTALAGILLMESAGNIAIAFNAMQEAADELLRDARMAADTSPT